jgi:YfiH family protein
MNYTVNKLFTTMSDGNIAFHVTDDKRTILENRKKLAKKYSFDFHDLKYMDQVHSNEVKIVDKSELYKCDGLVTNKLDTPLMVMVADCIPILFFDKMLGVISVAHAGRNGTYLDISSNVINKMIEEFACDVKNIEVELGPSIQKCCYEVSPELANIAKVNFGEDVVNERMVDLQLINKKQLLRSGVLEQNITISSICTKCGNEDYFSYRKDKNCGRFSGLVWLTS